MEQEILNACAYVGAIAVFCIASYIIYIQCESCKKFGIKQKKIKIGVIIDEPVAEVINNPSDVLPVANEVDEYLNDSKV